RLERAFGRADLARAGAGQVVPPPFAIDRERIAGRLGFSGVLPNSLHAYSSGDIEIEILAALASFSANLARLSETLFVWASPEFGFLRFAPEFTGTSYAMPQKQNPYALRQIRPLAAQAAGAWQEAMSLHAGSLQIVGNGVIHLPNRVLDMLATMQPVLTLLAAALPTLQFDTERMREDAVRGWSGIPQLVYHLVQQHGVPFRQAHEVGGKVVRQAMSDGLTPDDVLPETVRAHVADITGLHIEMDRDELRTVLNVDSIVDSRTNGGPAPASVLGDAEILQERLDGLTSRMSAKRSELDRAAERLANEARRD
ncbi:MAG: lyase family protein, partial [Dichotomicrobium sp.]